MTKNQEQPPRFVEFSQREFGTGLPATREFGKAIYRAKWSQNGKVGSHWKGVRLLKDPWSLALLPMLLWELKPHTIIELGAFEGGSALWMADQCGALGIECQIHSFDIDLERLADIEHPRIAFHYADCQEIAAHLTPEMLGSWPHPWLVIEDAHVNLPGVLEHLDGFLEVGDYLIVEDTGSRVKHDQLEAFILERATSRFAVDSWYCDNYGYNSTWNFNGFLRKMG